MKNTKLNVRSLMSFFVTAAFLVCVVTGIIIFITPQGRIANWVDWELLGLLKEDWANIHIIFGTLFLIAGIIHLYPYNWPSFKAYLAKREKGRLNFKKPRKELIVASVLAVVLVFGSITQIPPFSYVFDFNAWAKDAWVVSDDYQPPFGHAEEVALSSFSKKMNMDLKKAVAEMRTLGLEFEGPRQSLGEIAKLNGMSAMDVYMLIKKFERQPEAVSVSAYTPELVEERFNGTGVGKKTLTEFCEKIGFPLDKAKKRLAKAGIDATGTETMKDLANTLKVTPVDVLKLVLVKSDHAAN